ncbi:hypothetical protein B0H16DRAFT_1470795 [Mycena metata]|uniref:Uncharacterized protein n=1 Tax=Mycena metata TaxID=1033252 RepID=A0AAD7MQP8_9AGAR|nr:hypothetical protein B0H16DRAFT_1470795 [Mycena metata]
MHNRNSSVISQQTLEGVQLPTQGGRFTGSRQATRQPGDKIKERGLRRAHILHPRPSSEVFFLDRPHRTLVQVQSRTPSNPPSEVKQASTNESKPVHGYTWGTVTHTLSLPLRGNKNAQTFVRSSNFSKVTTNVAFSKTSPFYRPSSDKENCYPENIDSMV